MNFCFAKIMSRRNLVNNLVLESPSTISNLRWDACNPSKFVLEQSSIVYEV